MNISWIAKTCNHIAGVTITFSSCTIKVSAHAYIYPAIVKFCPDMGLHKTIVNIGNHTAVNVGASLPMLSWLCLKIWNNWQKVCQWSWFTQFHGHYITTKCITKNHPRASCVWNNVLLTYYCLYWHYVWTKLNLYWQFQYLSGNRPVSERYCEPCIGGCGIPRISISWRKFVRVMFKPWNLWDFNFLRRKFPTIQ